MNLDHKYQVTIMGYLSDLPGEDPTGLFHARQGIQPTHMHVIHMRSNWASVPTNGHPWAPRKKPTWLSILRRTSVSHNGRPCEPREYPTGLYVWRETGVSTNGHPFTQRTFMSTAWRSTEDTWPGVLHQVGQCIFVWLVICSALFFKTYGVIN